jgi:very-short-patch-repair endonuclease
MPRRKQDRNVPKARELRAAMSLPEVLLWRLLRGEPDGVKFRRQHPLGAYVLDFYCIEAKVCVEVDGIAHDMGDRPIRDQRRDAWLKDQGIDVVRIPAADVLKSPEDMAAAIVRYCRR